MTDWQAIKTEYITTQTSYRKLAQKYGIHYQAICNRSKEEGWIAQREQYRNNTITKTVEKISNKQADKMARIDDLADKLLEKLEQAIMELDRHIIVHKNKVETANGEQTTEFREAVEGGVVDRQGLKQIASALKDIKEVKMLRTELDRQEQEARIANLRKQTEKDEDNNTDVIEVVFAAGPEEWNE